MLTAIKEVPVMPAAMTDEPPAAVVQQTLRALAEPRRLIPILLVCLPLLYAQGTYSKDPMAIPLGIAMCITFILGAPVGWRVLFPDPAASGYSPGRLLLYGVLGAGTVFVVGGLVPRLLQMDRTFLTGRVNLSVCAALFLVGGWGLGRDIALEVGLTRERARAEAMAREAERAQLLAMRSHLDPHFLFNTLNAIAEWCREDGAVAERAVLQLSAILRAVLAGVRAPVWPVKQELEIVRTLFDLHLLRDARLFTLHLHADAGVDDVLIPPLLLLPLAENAVKHGPSAGHRGSIELLLRRQGTSLAITFTNPGTYKGPRPGSDGLPTVEKRLALAYGGASTLHIAGEGDRTRVELVVPTAGPSLDRPT